ncbi:MAG: 3'-5' exonuclease [Caldisericia bacterium]|nr:3'-5' exonuclease [Caldisericia bacterium]HOW02873.1 3'-5' exonuclease [Caldisericia bacterium]
MKTKKALSNSFLKELNKQQLEAVKYIDGPLAVFAGAGSGKTRVITYKIAYLLSLGISIDNILAVTFTNKAANEMKERLEKLLGISVKNLWIGTFHSICLKILRMFGNSLGIRNNFVIFDEEDSLSLVKEVMKELNIDIKKINPKAVFNAISDSKINLVTCQEYSNFRDSNYFSKIVSSVYSLYEEKITQNNALDFDDLIVKTVDLFKENKDVLSSFQEMFKYIFVDEYQDINYAQYMFIKLLSNGSNKITIVGDDDQSIYSFRGANPSIMFKFGEEFPEAKIIKLEQNYRSTENILSVANSVVNNNKNRNKKILWTNKEIGIPVQLIQAANERDEAQKIVRIIEDKVKHEGRKLSDFLVLYRLNAQSRNFEEALIASSVPYQIFGGFKFYHRKEIKDFLAYLRIIDNPDDRISILRVINYPKRNIGAVFINKIESIASEKNISFLDAAKILTEMEDFKPRGKKGLSEFLEIIDKTKEEFGKVSLLQLAQNLLKRMQLRDILTQEFPEYVAQEKIENIEELLTAIDRFEHESEDKSLQAFLSQISLLSDVDSFSESNEKVTLMTLHSAKGLEFPVVFLVGLEEGIFPHYLSNNNNNALEEERRLCYVGITRAKEELYLSYALSRELYGKVNKFSRSRFIDEIPDDFLEPFHQREFTDSLNKKSYSNSQKINRKCTFDEPLNFDNISVGECVFHKKWGNGVIKKKEYVNEDPVIEVYFESVGEKVLNLKYAPITKLI